MQADAIIIESDFCESRDPAAGLGPSFTLSLLQLMDLLEMDRGRKASVSFSDWRPAAEGLHLGYPTR